MRKRAAWVLVAALLGAVLLLWVSWQRQLAHDALQQRQRGAALFHGQLPLVARLNGHSQALPASAARCSNCHETLNNPPPIAAASGVAPAQRPYGGRIQGDALTQLVRRRGGPASKFDEAGFCRLLRTGVDPAQVMIPDAMPRYDAATGDCAALWAYLRHETN